MVLFISHPHGASFNPFVRKERTMRRWRRAVCPQRPKCLREYANILNQDEWQHIFPNTTEHTSRLL